MHGIFSYPKYITSKYVPRGTEAPNPRWKSKQARASPAACACSSVRTGRADVRRRRGARARPTLTEALWACARGQPG